MKLSLKQPALSAPPIPKFVRRASRPFRRRTKPGTAPGVIRTDPQAPDSRVQVVAYGPEPQQYEEISDCALDHIPHIVSQHTVTWVNVDGLGGKSVVEQIGEMFKLHPLALEDVVNVHQRAKVEDYDEFLFIVARMAWFPTNDESRRTRKKMSRDESRLGVESDNSLRIETEQVSLFLGSNFVVTFQERAGSDPFDPVRTRIKRMRGRIRELGPDSLMYALLDAIIDGYFPVIEELGIRLDRLDEDVLVGNGQRHMQRLHELRGDLLVLRRNLWPQREAVHTLIRDPHPLLSEETHYFLRDIYDHTAQSLDVVEAYRELCADLREYHYAQLGARTNEVMKVLTVFSTIFMPLTFIVGVYGMNFDSSQPGNMPELHLPYAYPITMGVMALIGLGFLLWFRSKGWLTRNDD